METDEPAGQFSKVYINKQVDENDVEAMKSSKPEFFSSRDE